MSRYFAFILFPFLTAWGQAVLAAPLNDQPLTGDAFEAADRAFRAIAADRLEDAVVNARRVRELAPLSELAARLLVDALSRAGRSGDALSVADAAIAQGGAGGQLYAQRGYLKSGMGDREAAAADFRSALSSGGLTAAQEVNVRNALREIRFESVATRAYAAAAGGDQQAALGLARQALNIRPGDEGMVRVVIEALVQTGRPREALNEADTAIARGGASAQLLAQRGYLRRLFLDYDGAAADFRLAIAKTGPGTEAAGPLQYALAEARAAGAEAAGRNAEAAKIWRGYVASRPQDAGGWFALGFLLTRTGETAQAIPAFEQGLQFDRRGDVLLQLGTAYLDRSAPDASLRLREAVDAGRMGDPTLRNLTEGDWERVRNRITESDQSIRTELSASFRGGRPLDVGGDSAAVSFETAVRFDGRYLPSVAGLETYFRGSWSREQTGFTESDLGVGLRWRPFTNLNFIVSGEWQHRIDPEEVDQFALNWGYSRGGIPYPYETGWEPFGIAGTFGSWRLGEERYLQSFSGSIGLMYKERTPFRFVIAPSLAVDASYDSADSEPFAYGVGPALNFETWLGGDAYRGYDARGTLQLKYLVPVGGSERQAGWQVRLGVSF